MACLPRLLVPLLALASATATARDLPADLVSTRADFFLKGSPKAVVTQNIAGVTQHVFDEQGILVSQMTGGIGQPTPLKVDLRKGRLVAVRYSPSRRSDAPGAVAMRLDDKGRATIITESEFHSPFYTTPPPIAPGANALEGHVPSFVRTIRYEDGRQVHDIYRDRKLLLRLAFDFTPTDRIIRVSCLAGDCANAAEYEYGEEGPVAMKSGAADTSFRYEHGVLVEESTLDKRSGTVSRTYYGNYQYDGCGNWTRREQLDRPGSDPGHRSVNTVVRQIDYREPCR